MDIIFIIIPLFCIFVAVLYGGFILIRKFPIVSNINVDTIPEEKESRIKKKILIERLSRKTSHKMRRLSFIFDSLWRVLQKNFRFLYQRAVDLDRKYRRKYRPVLEENILIDTTENLLDQADDQLDNENLASAEKRFIEVLAFDPHNYKAYKGLVDIYFEWKEYKKAKEVLLYLVKLNLREQKKLDKASSNYRENYALLQDDLGEIYYDLGSIANDDGDLGLAYDYFNEATRLRSQNPKYLDALLDIAISCGKKSVAIEVFGVLKNVNPENKKLEDFSERIKCMNV